MLTYLKNIFSKMAVIIIIGLAAICFFQRKKISSLDEDLQTTKNNYEYYQSLTDRLGQENRVLQLSINDLNNSRDSLIQDVRQLQKELKIMDKNLKEVHVINTEVRDTVQVTIEPERIDFEEELKLNSLTTIIVSKKDSILSAVLDFRNQQTLFVEDRKRYRNQYKNWFQRFIHFDFKKDHIKTYRIENSNDLMRVTDTRVIEIK